MALKWTLAHPAANDGIEPILINAAKGTDGGFRTFAAFVMQVRFTIRRHKEFMDRWVHYLDRYINRLRYNRNETFVSVS